MVFDSHRVCRACCCVVGLSVILATAGMGARLFGSDEGRDDRRPEDDRVAIGKALLEGLWKGRELVKTGQYRATEKVTIASTAAGEKATIQNAKFNGAFDVDAGNYRFYFSREGQ